MQQNSFAPCLCFLFFFFSPLSLALPQLVRFQIWPSCSNDTLPTTRICTASAVKNVSVFPRNTLPEGALNDVPGRVNTGDSDLLEMAIGSLSKTRAITVDPHWALSSVAHALSLRRKWLCSRKEDWKQRWEIRWEMVPGKIQSSLSLRPPSLDQVPQSTIWHRSATDRVAHRCWPFPKIT